MRGPVKIVDPQSRQSLTEHGNLRKLEPSDISSLGELMFLAYRGTVEDEGQTREEYTQEAQRTLGGVYGEVLWQASFALVRGASLVAATVVTDWADRSETLLAFVLVVPDAQGQGVGGSLIARSAAVLHAMQRPDWVLAVAVGNPAQRLYQRLGFRTFRPAAPTPPPPGAQT